MKQAVIILTIIFVLFSCKSKTENNPLRSAPMNFLSSKSKMNFVKHPMDNAFIKQISGKWDWNWKGTNWGVTEIAKKGSLARQLVIEESGEIVFYENGEVILKDGYMIKHQPESLTNKYLIELKSSKSVFSISLNNSKLTLTEPNCDCGCLTNEYRRQK